MPNIYNEIASVILKLATAGVTICTAVFIVPWIKNTLVPWLKEKRLYSLCVKFVGAAEKLAESGQIDKDAKKAYVLELLAAKGIKVTQEVDAFIENAVIELDIAMKDSFEEIQDAFEGDIEQDDYNEDMEEQAV